MSVVAPTFSLPVPVFLVSNIFPVSILILIFRPLCLMFVVRPNGGFRILRLVFQFFDFTDFVGVDAAGLTRYVWLRLRLFPISPCLFSLYVRFSLEWLAAMFSSSRISICYCVCMLGFVWWFLFAFQPILWFIGVLWGLLRIFGILRCNGFFIWAARLTISSQIFSPFPLGGFTSPIVYVAFEAFYLHAVFSTVRGVRSSMFARFMYPGHAVY